MASSAPGADDALLSLLTSSPADSGKTMWPAPAQMATRAHTPSALRANTPWSASTKTTCRWRRPQSMFKSRHVAGTNASRGVPEARQVTTRRRRRCGRRVAPTRETRSKRGTSERSWNGVDTLDVTCMVRIRECPSRRSARGGARRESGLRAGRSKTGRRMKRAFWLSK